ncbi:MAG: 30S ribosome-binding factor RbfA, partial [Candidatus Obscuribacterales bacterium]|nr:30S ribosome-binding factor RbfA [Candidatus Obscuribacterales bacterium]
MSSIISRDIKDPRMGGLVSITDVECSNDCRRAKIFVSVFGEPEQQQGTMDTLNDQAGAIRGELCRRLGLRFAPEISFKLDISLERGAHVSALLNKISRGEI